LHRAMIGDRSTGRPAVKSLHAGTLLPHTARL
jgi:hypothetical protein